MIIAIDGPSGAGKSTIAKLLAKELNIDYIDTGAMYRAVALKAIRRVVDTSSETALEELLEDTDVDLAGAEVLLDGEDVSDSIRTEEVSMAASRVSSMPAVRKKLVALQREMGMRKSVVMDGRDIGSNVFPDADRKFFITASAGVRAGRRHRELCEKGENALFEDVLADIEKRDYDDSHRVLNPLVKCDDAILVDTDNLGITEVMNIVISYLQ